MQLTVLNTPHGANSQTNAALSFGTNLHLLLERINALWTPELNMLNIGSHQ